MASRKEVGSSMMVWSTSGPNPKEWVPIRVAKAQCSHKSGFKNPICNNWARVRKKLALGVSKLALEELVRMTGAIITSFK